VSTVILLRLQGAVSRIRAHVIATVPAAEMVSADIEVGI
jgi:hypothetical protein